MIANALTTELLDKMDGYWRAAENYLFVGECRDVRASRPLTATEP